MRGTILLLLSLIGIYSVQGQQEKCKKYLSEGAHGINFDYTDSTKVFKASLDYIGNNFPELKGYDIEIRKKRIGTMAAAMPKAGFLFRKKENRRYVVLITDSKEMNAYKMYSNMNKCAEVGVLSHELCHIVSYLKKNNLQMLWFGIKYVFNRKEIEKQTDTMAIERGFGNELIEFSRYIHSSPNISPRYIRKKNKFYLSTTEIEASANTIL